MTAARRWLSDPRVVVDLIVVGVVAILGVVDVAAASTERIPGERPADGLAYALVIAAAVSLFWRRRAPVLVLSIVSAALIVFWLRGHGAFLSVLGLPALYAVAAHEENRRRAWWAIRST